MKNSFFVLVGLLVAFVSNGQIKINSPYSSYGIGDIQISEHANFRGMAHVGVSGGNMYFPSTLNPALLQRNLDSKLKFTITDFGFYGRFASLETSDSKQSNGDVNLNNVTIIFPLSNRSTLGIGLKPYSSINYAVSSTEFINSTDEVTYTRSGTGGLNKIFISDGFRIVNNEEKQSYFSLGGELDYVFGTIEEVSSSKLATATTTSQFRQFTSFSDVAFRGGLAYRKGIFAKEDTVRGVYDSKVTKFNMTYPDTLSLKQFSCEQLMFSGSDTLCTPIQDNKLQKYKRHFLYLAKVVIDGEDTVRTYFPIQRDLLGGANRRLVAKDSLLFERKISFDSLAVQTGTFFNFGFVYEHNNSIGGDNLFITERLDANQGQIYGDTLDNQTQSMRLPSIFRFGISFDKPVPYGYNKYKIAKTSTWSIGLDVAYNQWSKYEHFNKSRDLLNSVRTAVGGEYSPNPMVGKWMERWIYRAGLSYEQLPYEIEGSRLNEVGITFGASVPMGTFSIHQRRYPKYLNFSLEYGKRGTVADGLVEEKYFIATFSLTANSKWFTKRKIGL